MIDYSDKEILELFKDEQKSDYAFNLLVRKYQKQMYWHIRRLVIDHEDANDLVQNVFIKIWKNLKGFREDSQIFTWIYRIATNESLSFLKNKKNKYILPFVDVERQLSDSLQDDNWFSGNEIQLKLQNAILKLPNKQKVVFNMRYFDDMTYEEISNVLGTSVGALKASYHHAVKKIEEFVTKN